MGTGHVTERRYGTFTRTFTFPTQISSENVVAEAKDGVLRVTVHKAEAAKIRKIDIRPTDA